jgi:hypothetical protein
MKLKSKYQQQVSTFCQIFAADMQGDIYFIIKENFIRK